jgi:hypothetical protein
MRQVKIYCGEYACCESGCWGLTNLRPHFDAANITFSRIGVVDAERFGVILAPTIIFMKNDKVVTMLHGKNIDAQVVKKLQELKWV